MLLLLALLSPAHASATATELALAMEIPSGDIVSATVTGPSVARAVLPNLGVITPRVGANMAFLYTGQVGVPAQSGTWLDYTSESHKGYTIYDRQTLTLTVQPPPGAKAFGFQFYFLSAEYPVFVGSSFNDTFEANITGSAWSGNAAIDYLGNEIAVNSVLFDVTHPEDSAALVGTGFDINGGTGWLTVLVPVADTGPVTLELMIYDVADGIYDSGVLLDDFYWTEDELDEPIIIESIDVHFLSPKRGELDGGESVVIHGEKFNPSCTAFFEDVPVDTTFIDGHSLLVETAPWDEVGLIDVTVQCIGVMHTLRGGFTYFDGEVGGIPPFITGINPHAFDAGRPGESVVFGDDFQPGAVAFVNHVEVDTTFVDSGELHIEIPPGAPGSVPLRVVNPDGLDDEVLGAILYVDAPGSGIDDGGGDGEGTGRGRESNSGCNCATGPAGLGVAWILPLFLLFRRRTA